MMTLKVESDVSISENFLMIRFEGEDPSSLGRRLWSVYKKSLETNTVVKEEVV